MICEVCDRRVFRTSKENPAYTCTHCGGTFCGKHICFYVDDTNYAINASAPPYCEIDYSVIYAFPAGEIGFRNLLSSGDHPRRVEDRARFTVVRTSTGSKVTA